MGGKGSGGARVGSGPPPDPDSYRQARPSAAGEWTSLPPSGRQGGTPFWPLEEITERELTLWTELWTRPQAVMWEQLSQEIEVALYVRNLVEAEKPGAPVTLSVLMLRSADSLGLTTSGLRANRWRIATSAAPAAADPEPQTKSKPPNNVVSMRDRARKAAGGGA